MAEPYNDADLAKMRQHFGNITRPNPDNSTLRFMATIDALQRELLAAREELARRDAQESEDCEHIAFSSTTGNIHHLRKFCPICKAKHHEAMVKEGVKP